MESWPTSHFQQPTFVAAVDMREAGNSTLESIPFTKFLINAGKVIPMSLVFFLEAFVYVLVTVYHLTVDEM